MPLLWVGLQVATIMWMEEQADLIMLEESIMLFVVLVEEIILDLRQLLVFGLQVILVQIVTLLYLSLN